MKVSLKQYISILLSLALLLQIFTISTNAINRDENTIENYNYLVYTNNLILNEYSAEINGSIYSVESINYTGDKECKINGVLNTKDGTIKNIYTENVINSKQNFPDFKDKLNNDIYYKETYNSDILLSDMQYDLSKSLSVEGNLSLDQVTFINSGYIKADGNIKYNALNDEKNAYTSFLYSENGNVTIQGTNIVINGIIYAPKGKVELNAKNLIINGMIIADKVEFNGTNIKFNKLDDTSILNFKPEIDIKIIGEQKQNRKLTLSISENDDMERFIKDKTIWEITSLENKNDDSVCIDDDNSNAYNQNLIIKKSGKYLVRVTLFTDKNSYTYEKNISISKDIEPISGFYSEDTFYRTAENSTAIIKANDTSYSSDFDNIQNRKWSIIFDSDNDGDFDDEEEFIVSNENNRVFSYTTSHIGKYKIKLQTKEYFDNTIEKFIDSKDYLTNETQKIITVDNKSPSTNLSIEKSKKIDLVFTVGTSETNKINEYNQKINEIKSSLENKGFDVSVSTVETAILTAQDKFSWKEYDHINYADNYVPSIEKHILYQNNNIIMMGYGYAPLKDFLFVEDNNPSQKILSFDIQRDNNNWHTMEGGGFLFNSSIDDGYLTGYCILLTQQGLKLIYLKGLNVENLQNGNPSLLQNGGKVLTSVSVGNVLDNHKIKIIADSKNISVWDNDKLVIDNFPLTEMATGYGYGPITSHISHSCSQQSYFTFGNIKMETVNGDNLSDILNDYKWTSSNNRFVINLSDNMVQDLKTNFQISETAKALIEKDICFIGLGKDESISQYQKLLKSTEGVCFENNDINFAAESIEGYILSKSLEKNYTIDKYITTEDSIKYIDNYNDIENDPKYESIYNYIYNPNVFKNSNNDEIQNIEKDRPITLFENTGSYVISLKVRDNPVADDNFLEFRKWSDTDTFEKSIYVHTLPKAVLKSDVYINSKNTEQAVVKVSEDSYDPDHISEQNKGITNKKYSWKNITDLEWTEGSIPETINSGEIYLVKLLVCDNEGGWSHPAVNVISSDKVNPDFVDEESPEISLVLSSNNLNYNDKLSISVFATDNICVALTEIYIDDKLVYNMPGTYIINCTDEGEHTIKVIAEDVFGNKSIKEEKYIVTDNRDKTAPIIKITTPNENTKASNELEIIGTIYDENELDYYKIEYGLRGEELKTAIYSTEPVINGTLGKLNIEAKKGNIYNIKIIAADKSGNIAYRNITYTITEDINLPEEKDTIPPEIKLSADKTTALIGEVVTVSVSATDDKGIESLDIYKNNELIMSSPGTIEFSESESSSVIIKAVAKDTSGNISVSEIIINIQDNSDKEKPVTKILSPKNNEILSGEVSFKGDVNDNDSIDYYCLMYRKEGTDNFIAFCQGNSDRDNDILGNLDTTELENGKYTIRLLASDKSGNESYTDIDIEIKNEQQVIQNYERPYIEFNGNYKNGAIVLLNSEIELSLSTPNEQNIKSIEVWLNDEKIQPQNGIYSFKASKTGFYKLSAVVIDKNKNEGYCEYSIQAVDTSKTSKIDCEITSPKTGIIEIDENDNINDNRAIISDTTQIAGTAYSDNFIKYELSYSLIDTDNYITFAESTNSVSNDILGEIDPSLLENGLYKIRLRVYTASNQYGEDSIIVQINDKNKIGNYSFGFSDITIPVYTLPFTVSRTYNSISRNNSSDFGYGWKMDINNIKVDISNSFSNGWQVNSSSNMVGSIYTLKETVPHTITITYPNNSTETFYLSLYPKVQAFVPISYINSYNMVGDGDVTSKLEILDKYGTLMFDGRYNLIDSNAKKFEPKNFKLTTKQGIEYIINVNTGLRSITDKQGNTVTFDNNGITHSDGKSIVFERDTQNRIIKITDPDKKSVIYKYDDYGNLVAVTDRNGNTVHYIYGREHDLIDIIDPNGNKSVRNDYDNDGRLISSTDADGNSIKYSYDTVNRYETVIDEFGNQTVYGYDNDGNILNVTDSDGNIIKYTYDSKGNKLTETDKLGNTVAYTYDENNNITSITDAEGNVRKMTYSGINRLKSLLSNSATLLSYTYDKNDYISTITNELGNVETFEYDRRGALTNLSDSIGMIQSIAYDDKGNIKSTTFASGKVENYSYDNNGNCISKSIVSSDETSKTEFYTYDNNGNLVGVKDNLGNYSYGVYDYCGQLISSTDRLGNTVKYEYDSLGNLIKVAYPDNTTELYTYDIVGNMLTSTDRAGNKSEYSYDKFGNMISKKYPNGAEIKYEYDLCGNLTKVTDSKERITSYEYDSLYRNTTIVDALGNRTEYSYDNNSNIISMKDPKENIYKFEYDLAGNCTKTIYPDGTSALSEYDKRGRQISATDQAGNKTTYYYDNSNNLISIKNAFENETKYEYSDMGNLLAVVDANGNKTEYQYDTQDRLIKTILPNGKSISMSYDNDGNVLSSTDANGIISKYEYDKNGNVTKQIVGSDIITYTYTANGLIKNVTNGENCTKYEYNNLNQLTKKVLQNGVIVEYTYDIGGNLTKISTPYTSTSYEYDKLDRIVRVVDRNGNATVYEYDANGNRSAVRYANGIVATYSYDSLNRLIKEKIVDKNGKNIAVYEYTLDKNGNRIKAVEDGKTTEYEYDKLNRLTKETTERATTSYTYDKVGNRLSKTVDGIKTEYTYDAYNQLLKEVTDGVTTEYTYDNNGNLLKQSKGKDIREYSYDDYNRLVSAKVTKDGKLVTDTYTYDIEGNRLTKTTDGELTKYIVDSNGLSQVLAELDSNNKVIAEYTHGVEIVSQTRSNVTHYYLFDGNGNVRMLTDSEGVVSDTYDYDAFGIATASTGLTVNSYRYRGEYQDETTGLYYLRARYYDSTTGRFITADSYSGSISDPVSLHKYLYANGNPVMNSDPTGYFTLMEMSMAMNIQSSLQNSYNGAILNGLSSFLDALLGGEKDPAVLVSSFTTGVATGVLSSCLFGSLSAFGNMACTAPKLAMFGKLAVAGLSTVSVGATLGGALESFGEGKIAQGIFRMFNTACGAYGAAKAWGGARETHQNIKNGTACFVEGTPVLTEDGNKPIEDIEVGDYVYATDPETGESGYKEVLNTFIRQSNIIIHVFVNGEEIETTPTHPFWVENEWVTADKLKAGDVLTLADGTTCAIDKVYVEYSEKAITVYNFEVADFHSYYVTDIGVLVHNANYTKSKTENINNIDSSTNVEWTNHGYKHFPQKGQSWSSIVKSTKNGPAKYSPKIGDIETFEREAWKTGTSTTNGKTWKVKAFDEIIGATQGKETKFMRIEFSQGVIHGHPISKNEYKSLLK